MYVVKTCGMTLGLRSTEDSHILILRLDELVLHMLY